VSFILDALRKSDARRQESGPPGLNSPEPPQPPRRRRRRRLPWLLTAVMLLAVVAGAVYFARPGWLPERLVGEQPARNVAATPDPGSSETESSAEPVGSPVGQAANDDTGMRREARRPQPEPSAPADEAGSRPPSQPSATGTQDASDGTPSVQQDRRKARPDSEERTIRREPRQRESTPVPADEATRELERRMAEEARRREAPSRQSAEPEPEPETEPERDRSAARPLPDRNPAVEPEPEPQPQQEPEPLNENVAEYLHVWELPLSVRRNLPELKLTIHVYSPEASERFVLINGERYGPGDAIGEVEIVDIGREGAIVDFRSHRFLLEPR
jgi:general secretion pathway protein B